MDYSHYAIPAPEWVEYAKTLANSKAIPRPGASLQEIRHTINAERATMHRKWYGVQDDVTIDSIDIPTPDGSSIPARLYRPKVKVNPADRIPLYIHLHGGGWHLGNLDTEDPFCAHLCSSLSSIAILNVNYRHTPEHVFPTQPDDVWAAFDLFAARNSPIASQFGIDGSRIAIGGTSAGASLSVATAMREMRRIQQLTGYPTRTTTSDSDADSDSNHTPRIKGILLLSPPTVHPDLFPWEKLSSRETSSLARFANSLILPTPRVHDYYAMYVDPTDEPAKAHEFVSPLLVPDAEWDARLWPATSLHVSGMDALRDEGLLFAEKLEKNLGVKTRLTVYEGFPHAFNLFPELAEMRRLEREVVRDLRGFLLV